MLLLDPVWIDVTWGAGGSTSELTLEICEAAQNFCGLETMMHLTCTNMPREQIDLALKRAKAAGIQNILALRGGIFYLYIILLFIFGVCGYLSSLRTFLSLRFQTHLEEKIGNRSKVVSRTQWISLSTSVKSTVIILVSV
jgi:hypothetical protein